MSMVPMNQLIKQMRMNLKRTQEMVDILKVIPLYEAASLENKMSGHIIEFSKKIDDLEVLNNQIAEEVDVIIAACEAAIKGDKDG